MIPYGKQDISDEDIQCVVNVLQSDFLTQGPKVPDFEETVGNMVGAKYSVALNSATSALHVACLSLELGVGDTLWTTPITFVASANCGLYCGAKIDFVDIDPKSHNISTTALEEKLLKAETQGKLPKVLVVVHLCGQPCDMKEIFELSERFGFRIIEDASHAIGAKYQNEFVGNCKYSDITIFSFHPVKIITTAEGGMALTNNKKLAQKMQLFRSHGVTRDPALMTHKPDGLWYYQQISLGFNYRMTELQAALGISQMQRIESFIDKRHIQQKTYDKELKNLPVVTPETLPDRVSALHLYVIRLKLSQIKSTRSDVFNYLRAEGIGVNVHYIPVHLQPYFRKMGFKEGDFPHAERYYAEAISIPLHHGLSEDDQEKVVSTLKRALFLQECPR